MLSSAPPPFSDSRVVVGSHGVDAHTPTSLASGTLADAASVARDATPHSVGRGSRSWVLPLAAALVLGLGVGGWKIVGARAVAAPAAAPTAAEASVSSVVIAPAPASAEPIPAPTAAAIVPDPGPSARPLATATSAKPGTRPRPAPDKRVDPKKLPGGIHADSPY
jgi:hypothetical protein